MAFFCPDCHRKIDLEEDTAEKVTCPGCSHTFDVPDSHRKGVLPPGTRIGGFEVVRLVGAGGMGQVYEARQLSLDRRVALKIFSRKFASSEKIVERFLVEVRAAASLEHQNIVSIYEADMQGAILFLAMGYVDGQSVDKILEQTKGPIPEDKALLYTRKVAEAMEYAWRRQKLVHRDIKPANMLVDSLGEVKLCDLGIAKRGQDEHDITQAGMAIGTPHYISPEQGQGLTDIDFRADIYSLGASLFHMATGTLPYDGENATMVITKQIMEPLPDPRSRNPKLGDPTVKLIELMMAKLREGRHPSWGDLIIDIDRAIEGKYPVFRPPGRPLDTSETGGAPTDGTDTADTPLPGGRSHGRRTGDALIRVAALLLVLVLLVGVVVRLLRPAAVGPVVNQALVPDDGSPLKVAPELPPPPPDEVDGWLDPLARLPAKAPTPDMTPADFLKYTIRAARKRGRTPVDQARQVLLEGKPRLYEDILWYCAREYGGPDGKWAVEAAGELAKYYA
jgi:eukaryotic-like serine/threonine-protein kinase